MLSLFSMVIKTQHSQSYLCFQIDLNSRYQVHGEGTETVHNVIHYG